MVKSVLIFAVLLFVFLTTYSQEKVVGLDYNPVLNGQSPKSIKLKSAALPDTLELPFIDDFAGSDSPYPKPQFWKDKFAFINSTYASDPLSIGVATLDALDQNGQIYANASEKSFKADYLTSKPINLALPTGSNVFLSFYYQPQGLGDNPETNDSLIVDFYNPVSKIWSKVWAIPGSKVQAFKAAIIPVVADSFLVKGFQFRFRNLASIDNNEFIAGKMANVDHWHLDYVKLGANRTDHDTVVRDIALITPAVSLLNNYQSMPWKQFQASANALNSNITFTYRNNDTVSLGQFVKNRYISIRDLKGDYKNTFDYLGENIKPLSDFSFTGKLEYSFFTKEIDSAEFLLKTYLNIDMIRLPENILENDTSTFIQKFSNYYAYDDGTPEYGYGLEGAGSGQGKVAYKFNSYYADTLSAVKIYFNSTKGDITKGYRFRLAVWDASSNSPGAILYESNDVLSPMITGQYYTYKLETPVLVGEEFYVGWLQTDEEFLNIGLDMNNFAMNNVYYNLGSWKQSSLKTGALMMRPVFGTKDLGTGTDKEIKNEDFIIYPNPCSETLYIGKPSAMSGEKLSMALITVTGKTVFQTDLSSNAVNLSYLPDGVYFVVISEKNKVVYKGKLIVQH